MKNTDPDEAWLSQARARVAAGSAWERSTAEIEAAARAVRDTRQDSAPDALCCPYCDAHPPLELFRRYEMVSSTPLRYCPRCYGFWAAGDALARGAADPYDDHPALQPARAPRRCRACGGHLKPNDDCARCGRPLPPLDCPQCKRAMDRMEQHGVKLDMCLACKGLWFDMGELAAVYNLQPVQGLAASTVDEHATDDAPPDWATAIWLVARLFAPFLR